MYCNLVLLGNQASISHPIPRNKRCSLWRTLSWILLSLHIIHIPIIRNIKIIFNNLYMVLFLKLIFSMFSLSSWTNLSYLSKLSKTPAVKTQKQTSPIALIWSSLQNNTHTHLLWVFVKSTLLCHVLISHKSKSQIFLLILNYGVLKRHLTVASLVLKISLASSKLHFSSLHSRSRFPGFISSRKEFARRERSSMWARRGSENTEHTERVKPWCRPMLRQRLL